MAVSKLLRSSVRVPVDEHWHRYGPTVTCPHLPRVHQVPGPTLCPSRAHKCVSGDVLWCARKIKLTIRRVVNEEVEVTRVQMVIGFRAPLFGQLNDVERKYNLYKYIVALSLIENILRTIDDGSDFPF